MCIELRNKETWRTKLEHIFYMIALHNAMKSL